jgi:phage gpG-like protein
MQISLTPTQDNIGPALAARAAAASNLPRIHGAMGLALVGLTKRAFNEPDLRAAQWPAKANGSEARLRKTGTLAKSIRVVAADAGGVTVGSDRKYAAIHQLGGVTSPHVIRPRRGKALAIPGMGVFALVRHPGSKIPARPFFPFYATGQLTPRANMDLIEVVDRMLTPGL